MPYTDSYYHEVFSWLLLQKLCATEKWLSYNFDKYFPLSCAAKIWNWDTQFAYKFPVINKYDNKVFAQSSSKNNRFRVCRKIEIDHLVVVTIYYIVILSPAKLSISVIHFTRWNQPLNWQDQWSWGDYYSILWSKSFAVGRNNDHTLFLQLLVSVVLSKYSGSELEASLLKETMPAELFKTCGE